MVSKRMVLPDVCWTPKNCKQNEGKKKRNDGPPKRERGYKKQSDGTKNRTRVHPPKPPFYKTALFFLSISTRNGSSRSYKEKNWHPNLPRNFMTLGFCTLPCCLCLSVGFCPLDSKASTFPCNRKGCNFLLTIGSYLPTVEPLCLQLSMGALLLTTEAFILTALSSAFEHLNGLQPKELNCKQKSSNFKKKATPRPKSWGETQGWIAKG